MFDYRRVAQQYHPERKFCPMSSAFGLKMSAENRRKTSGLTRRSSKIPMEFLIISPQKSDSHGISHHFPPYFPPKKVPFLSMAGFAKNPIGSRPSPRGPAQTTSGFRLLHVSSLRMKTPMISMLIDGIDGL